MANHTIDFMSKPQMPAKVIRLRAFVKFFNVFMGFVPNFVKTVSKLSKWLRKTQAKKLDTLAKKKLEPLQTVRRSVLDRRY